MIAALERPQWMAVMLLMASSGVLYFRPPRQAAFLPDHPALQASSTPAVVGAWQGKPLAVDPRAVEILETEDVALMEYRRKHEPPVWLAQVAGFGNRAAFHPPELCYVGSHFEVLNRGQIARTVNGQEQRVMRLVIGENGKRYEAWYWFSAGHRTTPSYYQQQLWLLSDTIRQKAASGTLVRISTLMDEPSLSQERLLDFLASWNALNPGKNR